ncbi:conserved hypothetical protein [Culex quinquefasciatus]|uniref:Odorant receptor n=1 Tax=Culex quinquefasciatus TaxID=7176 RepID=B0W0I1_CULQU|nr:conserved hypothetical protein [Culex quinquefasciatus]|eukprot:XP_001842215.1 conserved hypothetical protein [Culex quinquefasciatus]
MKFYELREPMAAVPFILRVLRFSGLLGCPRGLLRFGLSFLGPWLVIGLPKLICGFGSDLGLNVRGYAEVLFMCNIDVRMLVFFWHRRKLAEFVEIVQRAFDKVSILSSDSSMYKMILKSNQMMDKSAKSYVLYTLGTSGVFLVLPALQSCGIYFMNHGNDTVVPKFVTATAHEESGWDVDENIVYYFIHVMLITPMHLLLGLRFATIDTMIFCGVRSTILLFRLVSAKLEKLHKFSGSTLREQFLDVVNLHVDALRCVQILEGIFSFVVMVQLVSTVIIWIAMVLCVSNNPNANAINLFVLLILITAQSYILCRLGTELTAESFAVATSSYDCQWIQLPADIRSGVGRILQRAQKWEGITAAHFFQLDVERFGAMVQTSYSIFVILRERLMHS